MRLLFVVQHFHQGWGGAPESVRLTARRLAQYGIASDVVDRGRRHIDIGTLNVLPLATDDVLIFDHTTIQNYAAVLIVGPWQDYRKLRRIVKYMNPTQPLIYLPRGGLADIEFRREKWLKKTIYLRLLEHRLLDRADKIIFSSELERNSSSRIAQFVGKTVVIPDHFQLLPNRMANQEAPQESRTIGFLAEIGVRKGLLPFLHGLIGWHRCEPAGSLIVLRVAGAARPDSAAYLDQVHTLARQAASGLSIEFVGPVAHDARSNFYAGCDVFVVPSLFESYCLTLLEALGSGCAVIASPRLGVLEQLAADPAVTIAPEWSVATIGKALDGALRLKRGQVQDFASAAVEQINDTADRHWLALLNPHSQAARRPN